MKINREIEGTYYESKEETSWTGNSYTCNECGFTFMTEYDLDKCYCPNCGRSLIWNEANEDE